MLVRVATLSEGSSSELIQVVGRIQFFVVIELRSLYSCQLLDRGHSQLQSPPHVLAIDLTLLTRIRFSRVTSVLLLAPLKDSLD